MNNLVVDIGNTRVKVAVVSGFEVVCERFYDSLDDVALRSIGELGSQYSVCRSILSTTRGDGAEALQKLQKVVGEVLIFDETTHLPIMNSYSTPETLGRDRLAAAVGATVLYDADYHLVVDVGSAITIDLVSREGGFEGGVISPGVAMRFRALCEFTASLPQCSPPEAIVDVARSTKEAIEQGVMSGVAYEIEGHIDKFMERDRKKVIIFTGGDAKLLINRIKKPIFANRELVIVGLNRILEYNAK